MNFTRIGLQLPSLWLPQAGVDLCKWAVVACDQYTSQPEYWARVEQWVGDAPSTLRLILPEAHLGAPDEAQRIQAIQAAMRGYLADGVLIEQPRGAGCVADWWWRWIWNITHSMPEPRP
jgi:Protein of unknown function (DUF1015)